MLCCFVIFVCADFVSDLFLFCPFILFYSVDKKIIPRVTNDVKLISGGKILENNKTIAQCRSPFGELPAGVITMHVVVQPSLTKIKTEKKVDEFPKKTTCSCSIL
uniref:UBL3-like ubiquitin domain-containing protein n=1 Tax=Musa acuminata subsp. malaccensis TaxID=214687 RepID=A0A804L611_MUSAM